MNIYFVLAVQILVASGTHVVAKSVVQDVDALSLTLLRGMLSSVGLILLLGWRRTSFSIEKKDAKMLFFLGNCGSLNQFLYLWGMKYTTAANGALLYAATPVFVLILSKFLMNESLTQRKVLGIALAFLGVLIVVFERGVSLSSEYSKGNLIVLCAVLLWTLYTVLGKPLVHKYGALKTTTVSMTLGTLTFLPFSISSLSQLQIQQLPVRDVLGIFYLGLGTSIVGYLLWYYALGRLEAGKLAVFANGQPIVATILSVIFLGAVISVQFVLGGVIVIAGVILAQLSGKGTSREGSVSNEQHPIS